MMSLDGTFRTWRIAAPLRLAGSRSTAARTISKPAQLSGGNLLAECISSGLENGRSKTHIPGMATIVQCNCGAEYRRTEEKFLVPHAGDAVCMVCGAALESWLESNHVPTYELIERPVREPE